MILIISLLFSHLTNIEIFANSLLNPSKEITNNYARNFKESSGPLAFLKDSNAATAISADKIINDKIRQRVVGKGFADIRFLGHRLQADHIEIQTITHDGIATGNVVFQTKNDRVIGTRAEFNLDSEKLTIFSAYGFIAATYYIRANVIRRLSYDHYEVLGGTFTSCKGDKPDWALRSKKTNFKIGGYAELKNPRLEISGFPVIASPWAIVPIKQKRASGFLPPKIGLGKKNGNQIVADYFWAINRSSDATFGLDYMSKRGFRWKGEYRFKSDETTIGEINGQTINAKSPPKKNKPTKQFWDLKGKYKTYLTDYRTDIDAKIEEAGRPYIDRSLDINLHDRTRQSTKSHVDIRREFVNLPGRFKLRASRTRGVNENDGDVYDVAPGISVEIDNWKYGSRDLYMNLKTSFHKLRRVDSPSTISFERFHLKPSLSIPMKILPSLTLTSEFGFHETFWTQRKLDSSIGGSPTKEQQLTSSISREMWFSEFHLKGPKFSKIYDAHIGKMNKFKHTIELESNYKYTPSMDSRDRQLTLELDSIDSLGDKNIADYTLTNRILTKYKSDQGLETRELLKLSISQQYNIDEKRRKQKLSTNSIRPSGDIDIEAKSSIIRKLSLIQKATYAPYESEINKYSTAIRYSIGRNGYLYLDRTWKRQRNITPISTGESHFNLSGGFAFLKNWFFELITRVNRSDKKVLEKKFILRRKSCCWDTILTVSDLSDKTEIFVGFNLLGVIEGERIPTFRKGWEKN
ncbi:MAG: LPS assembly protein LptD [Nitrospinota bacterium]|nr:LPS assembly protein LptD [Nitrospinota bacterium]